MNECGCKCISFVFCVYVSFIIWLSHCPNQVSRSHWIQISCMFCKDSVADLDRVLRSGESGQGVSLFGSCYSSCLHSTACKHTHSHQHTHTDTHAALHQKCPSCTGQGLSLTGSVWGGERNLCVCGTRGHKQNGLKHVSSLCFHMDLHAGGT